MREVDAAPIVLSPLSVVENNEGKRRLVLSLRHLNKFLYKQKSKYEDLRVAMLLIEKGDYLFSFDLKSGYHHVDIAQVHHKYLGFAWGHRFFCVHSAPFWSVYSLLLVYEVGTSPRSLLAGARSQSGGILG